MISTFLKRSFFLLVVFILSHPLPSSSYALLAHEAIIDASWEKVIKPLLKEKYPEATDEDIKKAHAFVFGGAIIPDLGYYPLGRGLFSDLLHYVRTGDFINALLEEAQNVNEYAFALGVLCHYEADSYGHSLGTNKVVPLLFPKLKNKYGDVVTFEEGCSQHSRVEFGFDVLQTAWGNYKPNSYHDFIGFEVSDSVLDRAFLKTYGIKVKDIFSNFSMAVSVFRFSVKILLPEFTRDAWKIKKSLITQMNPLADEKTYYYNVDKKNYRKEFKNPRLQSTLLEVVIFALPKYGPLSKFKPMIPDSVSEKLFEQSFAAIVKNYCADIKKLQSKKILFNNIDLDTGKETAMGEYGLSDKAHYTLLLKLERKKFDSVEDNLKKDLVEYYSQQNTSTDYNPSSRKGKKITKALQNLNASSNLATDN